MKNGVPRVGLDAQLRVIQTIPGGFMSSYLETLTYEEVPLDGTLIFVIECGDDFRVFPVYGSTCAMASMFSNPGDVLVRFVGCDVMFVLAHSSSEVDARLADVVGIWVAIASELVYSFFFEWIGLSLVGAAEYAS